MELERRARRFGISVVLFVLLFRLFEIGIPQGMLRRLRPSRNGAFPIQIETGHSVRSFSLPFPAESSPPADAVLPPKFCREDAEALEIVNTGSEHPDYAALMTAPLSWRLAGEQPTVLILHTHTTESYTRDGEEYTESAPYRTLDADYNMLSIGDRVAQLLEAGGIHVLHDRELHDYPSYNGAYPHARRGALAILEDQPQIQLILDLHRDAAEVGSGQLRTASVIDGQPGAQIMFVLGCGNPSLSHPDWQENLSAAMKLQTLLERETPGICRPISIRPQRFNQDLRPGTLLVEIGAAGNTHPEALRAAEKLASAILALQRGG